MNTQLMREIGRKMMLVGGVIFTGGFGIECVCYICDKHDAKAVIAKESAEKKAKLELDVLEAEKLAKEEAANKDMAMTARLQTMDQDAFAKYRAELTTKANADVISKAERMVSEADAKIVDIRLECEEKINSVKAECLARIDKANRTKDEAVKKYEAIQKLFTNRDEVLEAKKALDAAKKANKEKQEALSKISWD